MGPIVLSVLLYAIPLALAIAWLLGKKPRRRSVIALLFSLPIFYVLHYLNFKALTGWPSHSQLPQNFILIAEKIVEPNPKTSVRGRIYLWLMPFGENKPRAFTLPYDKKLHQKLVDAAKRRKAGKVQQGRSNKGGKAKNPVQKGAGNLEIFDQNTHKPPEKK